MKSPGDQYNIVAKYRISIAPSEQGNFHCLTARMKNFP